MGQQLLFEAQLFAAYQLREQLLLIMKQQIQQLPENLQDLA